MFWPRRWSGSKWIRPKRRHEIYRRDDFRCRYCGADLRDLVGTPGCTLDHVVPRSRTADNGSDNLVTACAGCNLRKGDRTPEEAGMPLLDPGLPF